MSMRLLRGVLLAALVACKPGPGPGPGPGPSPTPPSLLATALSGTQQGEVRVTYRLVDSQAREVALSVEYSTDGASYAPASAAASGHDGVLGLGSSASGVAHVYAWDSVKDVGTVQRPQAWLRLRASFAGEQVGPATVGPFPLDNTRLSPTPIPHNSPPSARLLDPGTSLRGQVSLWLSVSDAESDPVQALFEYSKDGQVTWAAATPSRGSSPVSRLAASPEGVLHRFTWDAVADLGASFSGPVALRLQVKDATTGQSGAQSLLPSTSVDNSRLPPPAPSTPEPPTDPSRIRLVLVEGQGQKALTGHRLEKPLKVRVEEAGRAVPQVGVDFFPLSGVPLTLEASPSQANFTNTSGEASVVARLGDTPGAAVVRACVQGLPQLCVDFSLSALAPSLLHLASSDPPRSGQYRTARWRVDGDGDKTTRELWDGMREPIPVLVETQGTDLPARFELTARDEELDLSYTPTGAPGTATSVRVTLGQGASAVSHTEQLTLERHVNASRIISMPGAGSEGVALRLEPVAGQGQFGLPGVRLPTALMARLVDDTGTLYDNQVTFSNCQGASVGMPPPFMLSWSGEGVHLTTSPTAAPDTPQVTASPGTPVYAMPTSWSGGRITVSVVGRIPDEKGRCLWWVDSQGGQQLYLQADLYAYVSYTFHVLPAEPRLEVEREGRWVPAQEVHVGEQVRVVASHGGGTVYYPPKVELFSNHWGGSRLEDLVQRGDAPSEQALPLSEPGAGLPPLSVPVALRSGPPAVGDTASTRHLVDRGGLLTLYGAHGAVPGGPSQSHRLRVRELSVSRRLVNPERRPTGSFVPSPPNPRGHSPRAGLLGWVYPHSGEVALEWEDLSRVRAGTQLSLVRSYRSLLEREGVLGPGWALDSEAFLEPMPGGLFRVAEGHGGETVFSNASAPPGCYARLSFEGWASGRALRYELREPHGNIRRFEWDGSLSELETRHGTRTTFEYDTYGRLVQMKDARGGAWSFSYHPYSVLTPWLEGRLKSVRDDAGREVEYAYYAPGESGGPAGMLASVTYPEPGRTGVSRARIFYRYDGEGRLSAYEDAQGTEVVRLSYAPDGRVAEERVAGSRTLFAYPSPLVATVTDPRGAELSLRLHGSPFGDRATPEEVVLPGGLAPGEPASYRYTASFSREGEPTLVSLPDGGGTSFFYETSAQGRDSHGNLILIRQQPRGGGQERLTRIEYEHTYNFPRRITFPAGQASGDLASATLELVYDHLLSTPPPQPRGNLVELRRPRTAHQSLGLNSSGAQQWFTLMDSPTTRFRYNAWGQPTERIDPDGHITTWSYDADGYLVGVVMDARANDSRRTSVDPLTPARPLTWTMERDALGHLRRMTGPSGAVTALEVDRLGRLWSRTQSAGGSTYTQNFRYGANGHLASRTEPLVLPPGAPAPSWTSTAQELLEMDAVGRPTRVRAQQGTQAVETTLRYDLLGQLEALSQGSATSSVRRDGRGLPWELSASEGGTSQVLRLQRDASGLPVEAVLPDGSRTRAAYDGFGALVATVSPSGDIQRVRRDPGGRWLELSWYDGREGRNPNLSPEAPEALLLARERLSMDELGRVLRRDVWRFLPDATHGRLATSAQVEGLPPGHPVLPDGPLSRGDGAMTQLFSYDRRGNLTREVDDDLKDTRLRVDATGQPLQLMEMNGSSLQVAHSARGQPERVELVQRPSPGIFPPMDSGRQSLSFEYDAFGRLSQTSDSSGRAVRYTYDSEGRVVEAIHPSGRVDRYAYTAEGRPEVVVQAAGSPQERTRRFTYTPTGRLASLREGSAELLAASYRADGSLERLRYADGSTESFQWDSAGRLQTRTRRDGSKLQFKYNPAGALSEIWVLELAGLLGPPATRPALTFAYDSLGRLVETRDTFHQTAVRLGYDSLGAVLRDEQTLGSEAVGVPFEADGQGRTVAVGYPGGGFGGRVLLERDSLGRLTSQRTPAGEVLARFGYRGQNLATWSTLTLHGRATFDTLGRPSEVELHDNAHGDTLARLTQSHAPSGLREGLSWTVRGGLRVEQRFSWDGLGRQVTFRQVLGGAAAGTLEEQRQYDGHGNLTRRQRTLNGTAAAAESFSADATGRYQAAGTLPIEHDTAGRVVRYGPHRYRYDYLGRLARVEDAGSGALVRSYAYDGFGRLLGQEGLGGSVRTVWAGEQPLEERTSAGTVSYLYAPGVDRPLGLDVAGKRYAVVADPMGHVSALVDDKGEVAEWTTYSGSGQPSFRDASGAPRARGLLARPVAFGGKPYDPDTGLLYHRMRHYHPGLERFLTPDPLGYAGGHNLYTLGSNAPWEVRDPLGLFDLGSFLAGVKDVVAEPFRAAADIVTVVAVWGDNLLFRPAGAQIALEDVPLASMSANGTKQRRLQGMSALEATARGEGEFAANLFSLGTYGLVTGHIEAYERLERGEITLAEYDAIISRMAGGATGAAAMGAAGQRYVQARVAAEARGVLAHPRLAGQTNARGPIVRLLARDIGPADHPALQFLNRPVSSLVFRRGGGPGALLRVPGTEGVFVRNYGQLGRLSTEALMEGQFLGNGLTSRGVWRLGLDRTVKIFRFRDGRGPMGELIELSEMGRALQLMREAGTLDGTARPARVLGVGRTQEGNGFIIKEYAPGTRGGQAMLWGERHQGPLSRALHDLLLRDNPELAAEMEGLFGGPKPATLRDNVISNPETGEFVIIDPH